MCAARSFAILRQAVVCGGLVYAAAVAAVWAVLYLGDVHWLPTLLLFGPRWVYAIPLLLIVPLMAIMRLIVSTLVVSGISCLLLGVVSGFCIPQPATIRSSAAETPMIRIFSCNVQGLPDGPELFQELVARLDPDILALQECDQSIALDWLEGWQIYRRGQLVIASRHALRELSFSRRHIAGEDREPVNVLQCVVTVEGHEVQVCNVHLRTPRRGFEQLLELRPSALAAMQAEIHHRLLESRQIESGLRKAQAPLIVCGDFNMPEDSAIYRRCWSHLQNAFSRRGLGCGYTKRTTLRGWSYGMRIDHVLMDEAFEARHCWVAGDVGSDHLPIVADLAIVGEPPSVAERPSFAAR